MNEANSLITEYNRVITVYGGSIVHWVAGSNLLDDWGEVSNSTKFVGSTIFIGMVQDAKRVMNYREFGKVSDDDSICFAMSGLGVSVGDKLSYMSIDYQVSDLHTKVLSDKIIYHKLLLSLI